MSNESPTGPTAADSPAWTSPPTVSAATTVFTDPVAAALASLAQLAEGTRQSQQQLKKAQVELRKAFEKKQVAALRDRAKEMMSGALVSAGLLGVSSALHFASASSATSRWAGQAEVAHKASDLAGRVADASAIRADARGKSAEHSAKAADDQAKAHEDDAAAAAELAAKAYEAIRAVQQSRHSAQSAAASLRG